MPREIVASRPGVSGASHNTNLVDTLEGASKVHSSQSFYKTRKHRTVTPSTSPPHEHVQGPARERLLANFDQV